MTVFIVMGVSGVGKSSIGEAFANASDAPFLEGDSYHPDENVAKMTAGVALTDEDRVPWLRLLSAAISDAARNIKTVVASCSALKRAYRDALRDHLHPHSVVFVYIKADPAVIESRMKTRTDHYMPPSLLQSQLQILEEPSSDESYLLVENAASVEDAVNDLMEQANGLSSN